MRQRVILAYLLRLDEFQSLNSARPATTGQVLGVYICALAGGWHDWGCLQLLLTWGAFVPHVQHFLDKRDCIFTHS